MTVARTLTQLAQTSRALPDSFEQFPRDLESLVLYQLEIPLIRLHELSLATAHEYLCLLSGCDFSNSRSNDRPLLGLLNIGPPVTTIFLRSDLSPEMANYVLAHELAHFIGDVLTIKELWLKTLSDQASAIEQVFEWQKNDPWLELQALVKGLPPRPRAITARGTHLVSETPEREIQADLSAREIMAPWDLVAPLLTGKKQDAGVRLLREQFGLPPRVATGYHEDVQYCQNPPQDAIDRLFGPLIH